MTNKTIIIIASVCIILGLVGGIVIGYVLYNPETVVETDSKEKPQKDGSVVIQKVIDTVLQDKLIKVKDTKIVKEIEIRVTPGAKDTIRDTVVSGDTVRITSTVNCDTVKITMHILRHKDNSLSVQAKATGGEIVGAIDIPRENVQIPKKTKNRIGLDYTYQFTESKQSVGLSYSRDIGPFVLGGRSGLNISDPSDIYAGASVGIRF